MTTEEVAALLETRAPGAWELYFKQGASRETVWCGAERTDVSRSEEGLAARWWDPASRFAAAGSPDELARAVPRAAEAAASPGQEPAWPRGQSRGETDAAPVEPPPELFEELRRLVAVESRGRAELSELSVRRGRSAERVINAAGLDVSWSTRALTGFAAAVGRQGVRACEARLPLRWEAEPDLPALARRLSDRATLPLSPRAASLERGEWLLDGSVAAALLAGLAPLFSSDEPPAWARRGTILPPHLSIVDDATAEAPFDGEGTRSRRVAVVAHGALAAKLHDLASARRTGQASTGHGVRRSYRTPPVRAARRLFFETERPVAPRELLGSVRRGLFASALTAPLECDLENDRFEAVFTGVAVVAGRAEAPVAGARARGRLSELLRRVSALAPDGPFFPMPDPVGGATLLVERARFE